MICFVPYQSVLHWDSPKYITCRVCGKTGHHASADLRSFGWNYWSRNQTSPGLSLVLAVSQCRYHVHRCLMKVSKQLGEPASKSFLWVSTFVCRGFSAGKAFCIFHLLWARISLNAGLSQVFFFCLVKKDLKKAEESGRGICFAKEGDDNRISCKDISSFQVTKSWTQSQVCSRVVLATLLFRLMILLLDHWARMPIEPLCSHCSHWLRPIAAWLSSPVLG